MTRAVYKYRVVAVRLLAFDQATEEQRLNELAEEGWELVSAQVTAPDTHGIGCPSWRMYYFFRTCIDPATPYR